MSGIDIEKLFDLIETMRKENKESIQKLYDKIDEKSEEQKAANKELFQHGCRFAYIHQSITEEREKMSARIAALEKILVKAEGAWWASRSAILAAAGVMLFLINKFWPKIEAWIFGSSNTPKVGP